MKILKRPKFKRITCHICGCIYQPQEKDVLTKDGHVVVPNRVLVECPVCHNLSFADPEKKPPQPDVTVEPIPEEVFKND